MLPRRYRPNSGQGVHADFQYHARLGYEQSGRHLADTSVSGGGAVSRPRPGYRLTSRKMTANKQKSHTKKSVGSVLAWICLPLSKIPSSEKRVTNSKIILTRCRRVTEFQRFVILDLPANSHISSRHCPCSAERVIASVEHPARQTISPCRVVSLRSTGRSIMPSRN